MADIAFIALGLGFLALCALYVRGLDHIVRSAHEAEAPPDLAAATAGDRAARPAVAAAARA